MNTNLITSLIFVGAIALLAGCFSQHSADYYRNHPDVAKKEYQKCVNM